MYDPSIIPLLPYSSLVLSIDLWRGIYPVKTVIVAVIGVVLMRIKKTSIAVPLRRLKFSIDLPASIEGAMNDGRAIDQGAIEGVIIHCSFD